MEPVSLADAKAHLRKTDDSEDALIDGYIRAAREWVENYTGRILVRRTITEYRDRFVNYLVLTHRPVVSVDVVDYTDTDGTSQSVASFLSSNRYPIRVYPAFGESWPSLGTNGEISISYTAGYAEGDVPQALVQAMLLMIGHFDINRSAVTEDSANEVPLAAVALCDQFREPVV